MKGSLDLQLLHRARPRDIPRLAANVPARLADGVLVAELLFLLDVGLALTARLRRLSCLGHVEAGGNGAAGWSIDVAELQKQNNAHGSRLEGEVEGK
jgi:hypothetical protein